MRRLFIKNSGVIIAMSLVSFLALFIAGCAKSGAGRHYAAGTVLVQFKEGLGQDKIDSVIKSVGASVKDIIKQQNVYVLSFSKNISPAKMAERLKAIEGVKWAEPDYLQEVFFFPVPRAYAEEYDLGIPAIAPSPSPSGKPIIVAVIDTGVNAGNPALAGKVIEGYNFYNNTSDANGSANGLGWHGTAVSGEVISGSGGGANIQIMPLQVNDGESRYLSSSAILKAIYYAADNGASIINMSFGGASYSPLMQQAIDYATGKGVIMVAAAGNNGSSNSFYPAAYNNVIAVGATNAKGQLAGFSNYGSYIDLIAPGWGTKGLAYNGGEQTINGTSFASPFIAGLAALLKSYFPSLSPHEVEAELKALAQNKDGLNPLKAGMMGAGFLGLEEVARLVKALKDGVYRLVSKMGLGVPAPSGRQQSTSGDRWLIRGKAHQGTYEITPEGQLIKK